MQRVSAGRTPSPPSSSSPLAGWLPAVVVLGALACAGWDLLGQPWASSAPDPSPLVGTAVPLAWAVVWLATSALVVGRARRGGHDRHLWRTVALFVVVVGAAVAAHPLLVRASSATVEPAWLVALAVLPTGLAVYSALVRWNLTRTHSSDPGDLLNGLSAVLAGQALLGLLVSHFGSAVDLPWWQLQPVLAASAAAITLTGTALSTAMMVGGRDRTAWLFVLGCAAALVGGACLAVGEGTGDLVPGTGAAWAVAAACVAVAAAQRTEVAAPRALDAASATVGAYGVLLLAVGVLVVGGLLPGSAGVDPWVSATAALSIAGAATRLLLNLSEVAQLAVSREEAVTDELTGLANRRGVLQRIDALVAEGGAFSLALIDLDRFKEVNDGLGHAAGDALLVEVGRRLRSVPGPSGATTGPSSLLPPLVGRLGGDEFAVVSPLPAEAVADADVEAWGVRLTEVLEPAYALGSAVVHVGCSAGVTVHHPAHWDGRDGADLLRSADAAMYDAKRSGGGSAVYDRARHAVARPGLRTAEELRAAMVRDELVLHHQPQLDVATGEVVGVEALLRWQHPERGLLGPGEFLPAAEGHGLMGPLTAHVLAQAARQAALWRAEGLDLRMSVNVSATNLADRALPQQLAELLLEHGLPASCLVLEITESVLVRDDDRTVAVLAELADLGVEMSIDDFGTGWSSLAQLHRLRFTELKLDRSFIVDLLSDERAVAITASTIDLAHALGLRVVAEGVEDEATLRRLADLRCDVSQGWLHARAMPADELVTWVARHAGRPPHRSPSPSPSPSPRVSAT